MQSTHHPTQIFLSNPHALRVEFRIDDQRLEIWWSPRAGESADYRDRNYSSRDAHLRVFESIELPGCSLAAFRSCEYDPYHCRLRFADRTLDLAVAVDAPALLLWSDAPQVVEIKTARFDRARTESPDGFVVEHTEPRYTFHFAARTGPGGGGLRHCPVHGEEAPYFVRAELASGQPLVLGVGLREEAVDERLREIAARGSEGLLADLEAALAPVEAAGRVRSPRFPELMELRRGVVRGLHSMIDNSGAFRASLKAIYYLIWIRDAGFSFPYQEAAGWPHKLPELCRLLLENPCHLQQEERPPRRVFGQLINRTYGKLEEDGLYYVVWVLFTYWTHYGHLDCMRPGDWELLEEALAWVEETTWDGERGLFGESFADETPVKGARDHGWDYAIGKPLGGKDHLRHGADFGVAPNRKNPENAREPVVKNYDVYFQILMHSTYTMLGAMTGRSGFAEKAARLWPELERLLHTRDRGIPVYGELLLANGRRVLSPAWGEARSCCVWGLTMPNFAPLEDWDTVLAATMDAIIAEPEMHWLNGIASAMAAVDTWCYDEEKLLGLHQRLARETNTPGKFLPMGGAMPEKFNAPQGNLYHDIRPQGFAMGAWLAAWTSLGLRRLPYGLALRPTRAFAEIEQYPWRGTTLRFLFGPAGPDLALEIDGQRCEGTLQVPEEALTGAAATVRLVPSAARPLWLRSTVRLDRVAATKEAATYHGRAFGLARITFSGDVGRGISLTGETDRPVPFHAALTEQGLTTLFFEHSGPFVLRLRGES